MKKICQNCRYYMPPSDDNRIKDFGTCRSGKLIDTSWYGYDNTPLNDRAGYWSASGYDQGIYVGHNFGCIHFEKSSSSKIIYAD